MNEQNISQAFAILSAEHIERVIENRLMRAQIVQMEAKIRELTPPPEGEKAQTPLEVVK